MIDATCEVWVDGVRVADTAADLTAGAPTALDGLSITWGRETTADQPDPSTCTWAIRDRQGGGGFLDTLSVGHPVQVFAEVAIPATGDYADNVVTDPGYETLTPGTSAEGIRALYLSYPTVVAAEAAPHGNTLAVGYTDQAVEMASVSLTPAPCSTATGAWDFIPTVQAGLRYRWSVDVWAPAYVRVQAAMVTIDSPDPHAMIGPYTVGPTVTRPGTGGWQTIAADVDATRSGGWPGVQVGLHGAPTWDAMDPAATWDTTPGTWADYGPPFRVDNLVIRPPAVANRRVLVWAGRITDLVASPSEDGQGVAIAATAVDFAADLANVYVGDQPWVAQTMASRFARILALVGPSAPIAVVDPSIGGYEVSWRDVDSQAAQALLSDLATTVDGVMWAAAHISTGPRLWVEDPANRAAVATIGLVGDLWTITVTGTASGELVTVTSCDLLAEPVQWTQDTSEVITRVDATYLAQTLDDDGQQAPTEAHVLVTDAATEAVLGVRRLGWTSQLTQAADAAGIAEDILARSRAVSWRISGLTWDTALPAAPSSDDATAAANLLDGTLRLGLALVVTDLPAWSPSGGQVGVYVEGGTWSYAGGRWTFAMTVTPGASQASPMTWDQAPPGWTWDTTDPAVDWRDLAAVGTAPPAHHRRPPHQETP